MNTLIKVVMRNYDCDVTEAKEILSETKETIFSLIEEGKSVGYIVEYFSLEIGLEPDYINILLEQEV
jgi:hypothetical protein